MRDITRTSRSRLCATLLTCVVAFVSPVASAEWLRADKAIMGTAIEVQLWAEDVARGEADIAAVIEEMHRIDNLMSTWKPESEISHINRGAAKEPVPAGEELRSLIVQAQTISERTRGAFDITYASVGFLYDYRERVRPDDTAVAGALESVDYRLVTVDDDAGTVSYAREGVRIDLGGIAKGYAVERGIVILRNRGVEHALVSAGGDTRVLGSRLGRPWRVGIRDPRRDGEMVALLPLTDEAISTSGDYERYFEADGERYHHIINPGTGQSASSVRSATVVGPDGTLTDALSTSVFVLGAADGLAVINGLDGFEAVVVDSDGLLHFSRGFRQLNRADSTQKSP